ncbi:MAG: DUF1549 domain-containing protein, partial [Prosthecobacter sp.]|nr:DUF1549 domain-containing protein [Prosthecobacter sp.]
MLRRLLQFGALLVSTSLLSAEHWAFQPLKRPSVPSSTFQVSGFQPGRPETWNLKHETSPNPIDAFIHHALTKSGLRPAPRADARTLIRRAHFDLTGLPPSDLSD